MWSATRLSADYAQFFRALGTRVRTYRTQRGLTREDMISFGFSVRHWQMVEAGRPITVITLLRVCEAFEISMRDLISNVEFEGAQQKIVAVAPKRKRPGSPLG